MSKKSKKSKKSEKPKKEDKKGFIKKLEDFYINEYKKLFLIPIILFLLAVFIVANTYITTGDFIKRDVTLKGGISLTIDTTYNNIEELETFLNERFPDSSINMRLVESGGEITGLIIEASDIQNTELIEAVGEKIELTEYSVETMGSSLGESFFIDMFKSLIVAFLFMGVVFYFYFGEKSSMKWLLLFLSITNFTLLFSSNTLVFIIITTIVVVSSIYIYIRYSLPTLAALISAFLDIFITLGIMDLMGVRLTGGGIAAYLMLIGYSIDTSILLSTKLLKEQTPLREAIFGAMKTGFTMSAAGIAATSISFFLTNNVTLKQIMLILIIGLLMDLITTWIGNLGILRMYLEWKNGKD